MRKEELFNQNWLFQEADTMQSEPSWKEQESVSVDLPHCWNIEDPSRSGIRVYQKEFEIHSDTDECVYLDIAGANGVCRAWLNGIYLGEHRGGYARFRFDLSSALINGVNRLSILTDNTKYSDLNPLIGDFNIYGGLYRDIRLIHVSRKHFDLMYYGSCGIECETYMDGTVKLHARTVNTEDPVIRYEIHDGEKTVLCREAGCDTVLKLDDPHLWNGRRDPFLYTLSAVLTEDGKEYDRISMRIGFRSLKFDPDHGAFLNGERIKLKGVAKHQDFAGFGNAVTENEMDTDMRLIRDMGANAVRLSHYQHPDHTYDLCDKYGILAWTEIPMLSLPKEGSEEVLENAKTMLKELILQQKHHPSVFCWGIQNEVTMTGEYPEIYDRMRELNDLVHELDPSRPSACANIGFVKNDSPLNRITDLLGYNLYAGWYYGTMHDYADWFNEFHKDNPEVCISMTEYGVESSTGFHSSDPHVKDYSEEYATMYHAAVWPQVRDTECVWGSFVWNMFDFGSVIRDEGGCRGMNRKGLVTYDRAVCKDAYYVYKAMWSETPFVHICSKRYAKRAEETTAVYAAANLESLTLEINGTCTEMVKEGELFKAEVKLEKGFNMIRVSNGGYTDECVIERVDEPEASYVFVDQNPEFNVANWFRAEDGQGDFMKTVYSLNDTMDDLISNPETKELLDAEIPEVMNDERNASGGSMSLIRILNYMRDTYTEDFARQLNAKLNKIKK